MRPEPATKPFATPDRDGASTPADEPDRYPPAPSSARCGSLVPCRDATTGCPLGVDVPAVARALAGGNHEVAFRIVLAANPFPSTCGAACHAPCETACRRRPFGAPVAIGALEQFAASFAEPEIISPSGPCTSRFESRSVAGAIGRAPDAAVAVPRLGKTVAIAGAGPAGLACANDLAFLGHRSVLFDHRTEPGGLLTDEILGLRFPLASARAECAAVLGPYAEFRGGAAIRSLRSALDSGFDAVLIAVGASRAAAWDIAIPEHEHIRDAMQVLNGDVAPVGSTIVVGEGALVVDAARALARRTVVDARARSLSIQLVLTTSLENADLSPPLLAACARDGIDVYHGWRLRRVQIDADSGALTSIDIVSADGVSSRVLSCDRLILAGRRVPDASAFSGELTVTRDGFIAADPDTLGTSMPNVWAAGACAFGHRSIAHAVADGKRAAWAIHASLTGARVRTLFASAWVEANGRRKPDRSAASRRRTLPILEAPPDEPFAPASPRAASHAGEEAARCFDCAQVPVVTGDCTSCGHCTKVCPTGAISIVEKRAVIAEEICNRCGQCVGVCPEDALTMLRAEWEERLSFA